MTSVPGAWRLAQDSARVAVKIDALICRAERDRVADLHIVAEQSEFHRGPAREMCIRDRPYTVR